MSRGLDIGPWPRRLARALADPDVEGVHQARIALRRLRVWLALGGRRTLDSDLRWLVHALAPVRDLDVLVGQRLTPSFRRWLVAQRRGARVALPGLLRTGRVTALLQALPALPAPKRRAARKGLDTLERNLRRKEKAWLEGPAQGDAALEALHALRRAVRRLRYAREWLGHGGGVLAQRQEQLGEAADLGLRERYQARFVAAGGKVSAAERQRLRHALTLARARARVRWRATR